MLYASDDRLHNPSCLYQFRAKDDLSLEPAHDKSDKKRRCPDVTYGRSLQSRESRRRGSTVWAC